MDVLNEFDVGPARTQTWNDESGGNTQRQNQDENPEALSDASTPPHTEPPPHSHTAHNSNRGSGDYYYRQEGNSNRSHYRNDQYRGYSQETNRGYDQNNMNNYQGYGQYYSQNSAQGYGQYYNQGQNQPSYPRGGYGSEQPGYGNPNMNSGPNMAYWAPVAPFGWNPFAMSMGQMMAPVTTMPGQPAATGSTPYRPLTPSPSPPPPPATPKELPEAGGSKIPRYEEYSSEEDEEMGDNRSEDSGSESESERFDSRYREKVRYALKLCEIEAPKLTRNKSSLVMNRKDKEKTVFPVEETMQEHFKKAWESISGNDKFSAAFSTEGPSKPVNLEQKFKPVLNTKGFQRSYGVEGEIKDTKVDERWPFYDWKVDEDFSSVFGGKKPEKKTTSSKCMLEVGKMLAILNQTAHFTKACNVLVQSFDKFVTPEGKERWDLMKDFLEVRNKSTEDLMAVATNLQMNLLVSRREEALKKVDLEKHEGNVLKFAPPVDPHGRLFNGKLEEFKSWKGKREQTSVVTDLLKSNRKRGQPNKRNEEDYGKRRKFTDERLQSFREPRREKKRFNRDRRNRFGDKKQGSEQKPKFGKRD